MRTNFLWIIVKKINNKVHLDLYQTSFHLSAKNINNFLSRERNLKSTGVLLFKIYLALRSLDKRVRNYLCKNKKTKEICQIYKQKKRFFYFKILVINNLGN